MNDDVRKALKEHYKEEADEHLFKGIRMEEALKQRILEQAAMDEKQKQRSERNKPKGSRMAFYKSAPIAAAALFMLVLIPMLLETEEPAVPFSQPELYTEEAPITEDAGWNETFIATEEPLVTLQEEPDEGQELLQGRHFESLAEAADALEGEMIVPGLLPDGFHLKEIHGYSYEETEQQPDIITLKYEDSNGEYFKITSSNVDRVKADGYEPIELEHGQGYIRTDDDTTHIKWTMGRLSCQIEGNLTKEDLLEIANEIEFYL